ncbi:MAG: HAMP domain-containing protein, partial [Armatimonadota bacterium]|nr:HAMP domain-containing protein [Armatimonadota bacterium]
MQRSIRWRLAMAQIVVVSAAMLAVAVGCERSVRAHYLHRLEGHLAREASLVRRIVTPALVSGAHTPLRESVLSIARAGMARITVVDDGGAVLIDSQALPGQPQNLAHRPEFAAFLQHQASPLAPYAVAIRQDGMHVAVPVMHRLRLLGVVRVSLAFDDLEAQLRSLRALILGTVLLATAVAVALSLYLTTSITGPIREVTEVALRMAAGDLSQRVVSNPHDEVGHLTRSFNAMAARIQGMMEELRREREKMARVFSQMADGLVVLDA